MINKVTLSGKAPCKNYDGPAPCPIDEKTGMHQDYWVLSEEERDKGFVRPVRTKYRHVGLSAPKNPLRELTEKEKDRYHKFGYVKYEEYPKNGSSAVGKFWTQKELDKINKGCGCETVMNIAIAETYARDPKFYGGTFCVGCRQHFPVAEFIWLDGSLLGS